MVKGRVTHFMIVLIISLTWQPINVVATHFIEIMLQRHVPGPLGSQRQPHRQQLRDEEGDRRA